MSVFDERKPNAGAYGVSANHDGTRANTQALREALAMNGFAPGFEIPTSADRTYNSDSTLQSVVIKESTAVATSNGRAVGTRMFCRLTFTYTTGRVTKMRCELSTDSGTSYSNWVDGGGNSYVNIAYTTAGLLDTLLWGTS